MSKITLTNEQLQLLSEARGRILLVDQQGQVVGQTTPPLFTRDELLEAKRRSESGQRRFTVAEKNVRIAEILASIEEAENAVRSDMA